MNKQELIEQLADKEHDSWARWMQYLFSKSWKDGNGCMVIPEALVDRWSRQADTPYAQLTEQEKQSDRDEVAKILPIIDEYAHVDTRTNLDDEAIKGLLREALQVEGARHKQYLLWRIAEVFGFDLSDASDEPGIG